MQAQEVISSSLPEIHISRTKTSSVSSEPYYIEKEVMNVAPKSPLSMRIKHTFLTRDGWFGNYDYGALCMPRIPFHKKKVGNSIFYGPEDVPPVFVALLMGIQRKYKADHLSTRN
jgi:hypothetical protein